MIVKKAGPNEFDSLLSLLKYQLDENGKIDDFDHNTALELYRRMAANSQYFLFVILDAQRPVGYIGGVGTLFKDYGQDRLCHIKDFYLLTSHRTQTNFDYLFEQVQDWINKVNVRYITAESTGIYDLDKLMAKHLDQQLPLMFKEI